MSMTVGEFKNILKNRGLISYECIGRGTHGPVVRIIVGHEGSEADEKHEFGYEFKSFEEMCVVLEEIADHLIDCVLAKAMADMKKLN